MTAFVNPLDQVPQVPADYANHVLYGGGLAWFVATVVHLGVYPRLAAHAWLIAFLVVLFVAALKKAVDFHMEGESWRTCLAKTVVTTAVPAWILALGWQGLVS